MLERNPALKVGLPNGGGFVPYQIGRWDHGSAQRTEARTRSTMLPSEGLRRLYFDTLTHSGPSLTFLGETVGWDRVMLGSDYPYDMAEAHPVTAARTAVPSSALPTVLESTAQRFLRATSPSKGNSHE